MTRLHQLIEFTNMQLAYRHDERAGRWMEKRVRKHDQLITLPFLFVVFFWFLWF